MFAGGLLKAAEKDVAAQNAPKQKKWAVPGTAQGAAVFIPDR